MRAQVSARSRASRAAMIVAAFFLTFPLAACLCAASALPAVAQDQGVVHLDLRKDVPKAVAAQVDCGTDPELVTRRPFAGGFVFAWPCAGNHANRMQALVFSPREDGAGATLLRFPGPRKKDDIWTEISNARWFPAAREVTQLFVDPETPARCRSEARWRLAGETRTPRLTFWRETRDCSGKRGWRVLVDRRGM